MPVKVKCPKCSRILTAPDERLGQQVKCPACSQVLRLPSAPAGKAPAEQGPAPATRAVRTAAAAPRKERPAEEEPAEGSKVIKSDAMAEERRKRRRAEYERKRKKAKMQKILAIAGMLIGALIGGPTYAFDIPNPKTGLYLMVFGVVVMGISLIVLFLTPKVGAPTSDSRAGKGD